MAADKDLYPFFSAASDRKLRMMGGIPPTGPDRDFANRIKEGAATKEDVDWLLDAAWEANSELVKRLHEVDRLRKELVKEREGNFNQRTVEYVCSNNNLRVSDFRQNGPDWLFTLKGSYSPHYSWGSNFEVNVTVGDSHSVYEARARELNPEKPYSSYAWSGLRYCRMDALEALLKHMREVYVARNEAQGS